MAVMLSLSMLTLVEGQASALMPRPLDQPDAPIVKDLVQHRYDRGSLSATYHLLDSNELLTMKGLIGVQKPGVDYNLKVGSMGTGLAPPSEEEWGAMEGNLKVVDYVESEVGIGSSFDLSTEPYFPQVRSQGSQGSCAAWAMTYYAYGYLEAKARGWTEASEGNNSQLMSPAWTYNKVNGGFNSGSSTQRNGQIIVDWGAATWSTMPYDQYDCVSWGGEEAWREAPLHRATEVYSISFDPSTTVNTVKNLVASGTPVVFAIDASQYRGGFADGNYIISSSEYSFSTVNHAQTIVGFDDAVSDDGDVGAFRVVNSWGSGWGDSGYYWLTYEAFKEIGDLLFLRYIDTRADYIPSLLGVWHFDDAPTRDADVQLGIGSPSSPLETRSPSYVKNAGSWTHRFPAFMCLDISEFRDEYDQGTSSFYLRIGSASSPGNISSFKVEMYEASYQRGKPSQVSGQSPDVPRPIPNEITNQLSYYQIISLHEALDAGSISVSTGGPAAWVGVGDEGAYGFDAARSGDVGDSSTSWMRIEMQGPAQFEFSWRVSSEEGKDRLKLLINGNEEASISGQTSWATLSFEVGQGSSVVEWQYSKDSSRSASGDCGWVDRFVVSTPLEPLRIDGDDDLAQIASSRGWPGSGTSSDPYIMEGMGVDAMGLGSGLYVGNTTAHLLIRDSVFTNASSTGDQYWPGAGIALHGVTNVVLENITCIANDIGISLIGSSSNRIAGCVIDENGVGLLLSLSDSNDVVDSWISDNEGYAIGIYSSSSNDVWGNILERNTGSGTQFDPESTQTYDDSTANHWSLDGIGNHYADWTAPDTDGDWIVDAAYQHDGSSQTDDHPLVCYLSPPHGLTAEVGDDVVTLRWEPSRYSLHSQVIEYLVYRGGPAGSDELVGATPPNVCEYMIPEGASSEERIYFVKARSGISESAASNEVSVAIVDDAPPGISITSPAQNSWKRSSTVTVEWTGSDQGSGIDRYEVSRDEGPFVDVGNSVSCTFFSLSNGMHDVVVRAYDGAGNSAQDSVSFGVDTVSPSLTISSPTQGKIFSTSSVTVIWQGSDSISGIAYYQVKLDGGPWVNVGTSTSHTFTSLGEGTHTAYVRAIDNAGNGLIMGRGFTVDVSAPAIEVIGLFTASGETLPGSVINGSDVRIDWTASDSGTGISHFEIRLDNGGWSDIGSLLSHTYQDLAEGEHTATVKAYDVAGNTATDSITFVVDTVIPVLLILSPSNGAILTQTSVTVEWSGSDSSSGVARCDVRLDSNTWIDKGLGTQHTFQSLGQGNHILTVRAVDAAGNIATASVSIIIDSIAPTVSITAPDDGAYLNWTAVDIVWEGQDAGSGVSKYWVQSDSGGWIDVGMSTSYQLTLANGEHTIHVRVCDRAGNTAFDSVRIVVDDTPLWIYITTPGNGSALNTSSPTITWVGGGSGFGISHHELRLDDGEWQDVGLATSHQFGGLSDGLHSVDVRIVDNFGNESEDRVEFTVDTTKPWLGIINPIASSFVSGSVLVEWEAYDDGTGIAGSVIQVDGGEWISVGAASEHLLEFEGDGIYTVRIRCTDHAGNADIQVMEIIVDTKAPEVVEHSPAARCTTSLESISVIFSEEMDPDSISIMVKGADGYHYAQGAESVFVITEPLVSGTFYTVTVEGQDMAGNHMEAFTWSFAVEDKIILSGSIVDAEGVPVADALVKLDDGQSCLTGTDGRFAFDVVPGIHNLTIVKSGYAPLTVQVSIDGTAAYDIGSLQVSPQAEDLLEFLAEPSVLAIMAMGMISIIGVVAFGRRD